MQATKFAAICFAVAAGITGLTAACYWHESAKLSINPGDFEPLEEASKALYWVSGAMDTIVASSTLNKKAARWTAVSVLLSVAAAILGSVQ